jgi:hypothetical protein
MAVTVEWVVRRSHSARPNNGAIAMQNLLQHFGGCDSFDGPGRHLFEEGDARVLVGVGRSLRVHDHVGVSLDHGSSSSAPGTDSCSSSSGVPTGSSSRASEEWIPLFDDPILARSALDRLAHNGYQIVMDGPSYRSRQRPGQRADEAPRKRTR